MDYGYKKKVNLSFVDAIQKTKKALSENGFGILSTIDMKYTLYEKLKVDIENYVILEACNPPNAHRAMQAEQDIGLLLPCNVIVYEFKGEVYVAAVRPTVLMGGIENNALHDVASDIENKLKKAIDAVK
ncbi:DUF302 domain-containing protein [Hippea jasoniae]|uniref:DUF302 domain-containing protein n=1 Tax=Hippea jasoniae TaxID=944479 RepID=UPI00054DF843|nr:DUF302 domain-containing protein [Hippea jasoniae]